MLNYAPHRIRSHRKEFFIYSKENFFLFFSIEPKLTRNDMNNSWFYIGHLFHFVLFRIFIMFFLYITFHIISILLFFLFFIYILLKDIEYYFKFRD